MSYRGVGHVIFSLHLGVGHSVLLLLEGVGHVFSNHHISKSSGPPPTPRYFLTSPLLLTNSSFTLLLSESLRMFNLGQICQNSEPKI